MKKASISTPAYVITAIVLLVALVVSLLFAVTFGTVSIPMHTVYAAVVQGITGKESADVSASVYNVVWYIRLPRLVLAIAVGIALSISGVVMQAIVKNPLADPYVLGISSGAELGATASALLGVGAFFGGNSMGIMAFIGAFAVSMAVVMLSNVGGRPNSVKLLLAGTALAAICGAFSNFMIYMANNDKAVSMIVKWGMGSLAGATWSSNAVVMAVSVAGLVFFWTQFRPLNLMLLGDETAITLGTDLRKRRIAYLMVSSLMVGFAVYAAGLIGFVGLVIPHIVRMIFGTDHKKLVPLSALTGSIFLVWADVLCRIVLPGNELPIGILTAMIGAPCFIYLMVRKKYGFGGGD